MRPCRERCFVPGRAARRLSPRSEQGHRATTGRGCFERPPASSAGAESQPSRWAAPRSAPVLGESSTRCSTKRSPTREPRCSTVSRKATRSYSSIASVVRVAGSSSDVPARAHRVAESAAQGRPSQRIRTPNNPRVESRLASSAARAAGHNSQSHRASLEAHSAGKMTHWSLCDSCIALIARFAVKAMKRPNSTTLRRHAGFMKAGNIEKELRRYENSLPGCGRRKRICA